jgi:hypothetical protein
MKITGLGIILVSVTAAVAASGCTTQSYCFADCDDAGSQDGASEASTDAGGSDSALVDTGYINTDTGASDVVQCTPTSGGKEICDGIDNDCNGKIDDVESSVTACGGSCNPGDAGAVNDCTKNIKNADEAKCSGSICDYTTCSQDYWDLDGNRQNGCEYYCVKTSSSDNTCDAIDEDCNGKIDDGIDKCTDSTNCGECGRNCTRPNAVTQCQGPATGCDKTNTNCVIASCSDGWIDADKNPNNGCEYACKKTKRTDPSDPATIVECAAGDTSCTIEYCDGIDNDCDGYIDAADSKLLDPALGDPLLSKDCKGSSNGECAKPAHIGITRCVAAAIKCVDNNTSSTACTTDADCTDPNTPYCVVGATPPQKVCGTKVIKVGDQPELCNNLDDDCDGTVDNNTTDSGGYCGTNLGICSQGKKICTAGTLVCSGQVDKQTEICNGADDDCDGVIDGVAGSNPTSCQGDADCATNQRCMVRNGPTDKVCAGLPVDIADSNGAAIQCDVPTPAPAGWTSPCQAGTLTCQGGAKICVGSVKSSATQDTCGKDLTCDGIKNPDFDITTDVHNCGACGHDCATDLGGHIAWTCVAGQCTVPTTSKCNTGYIDCDSNANDCERSCTFLSNQELCNGLDDNCNCKVDEMKDTNNPNGIPAPSATQICGVNPGATDNGCKNVSVTCSSGKWACSYPAGYCSGSSCASTTDICDGLDNNCNGAVDENYKQPVLNQGYLGQVCYSDDGLTTKHGLCQQSGTFQCDGTTATACMNSKGTKIAGAKLPCGTDTNAGQSGYACDETCDGKDNDCDGVVDETYQGKGTNATYFVKPAVVKIGTSTWVFAYEASRPTANSTSSGSGNGWWRTSGYKTNQPAIPTGIAPDKTSACSTSSRVPWFNVSGLEAQHVCVEMGGRLCTNAEWQSSCKGPNTTKCSWGYATSCTAFGTGASCNLGPYDFDISTTGNQDGLLPTAWTGSAKAPAINTTCYADWAAAGKIYDITGNLRELTCASGACTNASTQSFILMGGAFNTSDPAGDGSKCDFTFYNVDQSFKLYDAGFRCCFDADPTQ